MISEKLQHGLGGAYRASSSMRQKSATQEPLIVFPPSSPHRIGKAVPENAVLQQMWRRAMARQHIAKDLYRAETKAEGGRQQDQGAGGPRRAGSSHDRRHRQLLGPCHRYARVTVMVRWLSKLTLLAVTVTLPDRHRKSSRS